MPDGHYRHNRRTRNLMSTLKKAKNNDVRKAILEALQREFDRMKESRAGKAIKRGAIGASNWGKRVHQRGEAYAKSPARRNHTAGSVGAYARQQAIEREKNRPARDKAKQAREKQRATRQKQRQTRRAQRAQNPATGVRGRIQAVRAAGRGRMANGGNGTITRTSTPRAPRATPATTGPQRAKRADPPKRATPVKPATPARPSAGAREARAATPATRTPRARTPQGTPAARPARASRSDASKTG
jgi:hypothetical protein